MKGTTERSEHKLCLISDVARTKMKFVPTAERESMESIFKALKKVFGHMHTHIGLQCCFYNRRQQQGQENQLDALIPDSEQKVRPRRKKLNVMVIAAFCLFLLGMAIFTFFIFPCPVVVSYVQIKSTSVSFDEEKRSVRINITSTLDITNNNQYSIYLTNIKAQAEFSKSVIGTNEMDSNLLIKPLSERQVDYVLPTAINDQDFSYMFAYCTLDTIKVHAIVVEMQVVVTTASYFGITKKNFLETLQYVDCGGNATALFSDPEE